MESADVLQQVVRDGSDFGTGLELKPRKQNYGERSGA